MPQGSYGPGKRQSCFTLPVHIDQLVRLDAAKRRVRTSVVAAEILAAHYNVSPHPLPETASAATKH